MKYFKLLGILLISTLLMLTSCVESDDTDPCEEDNFGSVTVTNNTGEYWIFDVTYERSGTSWVTNEEVTIYDGESYTWEEVGAGEIMVWAYDGITVTTWQAVDNSTLSACENKSFSYYDNCELYNYGTVTVTNGYGDALYVDVYADGSWIDERYVSGYGSTTYYEVPAGTITFAAQWASGGDWNYSDDYTLDECDEFSFSWEGKKMVEFEKGPKRAPVSIARPQKINR